MGVIVAPSPLFHSYCFSRRLPIVRISDLAVSNATPGSRRAAA